MLEIKVKEKNSLLREARNHLNQCLDLANGEEQYDDEMMGIQEKAKKINNDIGDGDDGLQDGDGSQGDGDKNDHKTSSSAYSGSDEHCKTCW